MPQAKKDKAAGDTTDPRGQVFGYQEGAYWPKQPSTPAEFAALLNNPDLPAQFQAAPSPEQLNPHLFPKR